MRIHDLRSSPKSRKSRKRVGRGESSGHGKTSGRGHKGQKARSGSSIKPGFEGGQMPLHRRLPKLRGYGNRSRHRINYQIVNVKSLNIFKDDEEITPKLLHEIGLVKKLNKPIKILGDGNLEKKVIVKAHAFTKSAREKIEKKGGKVEMLNA